MEIISTRFRDTLATLALLTLVLGGCASSAGSEDRDGYWYGIKVSFEVEGDSIKELVLNHIGCQLSTCEAWADDVAGLSVDLSSNAFTLTTASGDGTLTLTGSLNGTMATGTYKFVSGCCSKEGTWNSALAEPGTAPDTAQDTAQDLYFEDPAGIALELTNTLRGQLGLKPIVRDPAIEAAAQAHAEYFTHYCEDYGSSGLSPHRENPDWTEGYTGIYFWNRMVHAGFEGQALSEIIAFEGNPYDSFEGWLLSLYHRLPLVSPAAGFAGYGVTYECCIKWSTGVDVMDFAAAETPEQVVVMYPWDGQTGVPTSWSGLESPEPPLPDGENYPSGPIVTLTLPYKDFAVESAELLDPDGEPVVHQLVTPDDDPAEVLKDTVSIYSVDPLLAGATYTVRIQILPKDQEAEVFEWSFTTTSAFDND